MAVDTIARRLIWERFERDQPNPGPAFEDWVTTFSQESGVLERDIRKVATEGSATLLNAINQRAVTLAQSIAERMGATLVSAFQVLQDAYSATKKKVLLDRGGKPKLLDPELGYVPENMIYIEVPDWQSRLAAVRMTIDIFGAHAPTRVEFQGSVRSESVSINFDIPIDQAMAELKRLEGVGDVLLIFGLGAVGDPEVRAPN